MFIDTTPEPEAEPSNPHEFVGLEDQRMIDCSELGKLIGRSTKSIRIDASRRPDTLPPTFKIPGTAKLKWRVKDVRAWLEALAEIEAERRVIARQLAHRAGHSSDNVIKSFAIGRKDLGLAATRRLAGKQGIPDEAAASLPAIDTRPLSVAATTFDNIALHLGEQRVTYALPA